MVTNVQTVHGLSPIDLGVNLERQNTFVNLLCVEICWLLTAGRENYMETINGNIRVTFYDKINKTPDFTHRIKSHLPYVIIDIQKKLRWKHVAYFSQHCTCKNLALLAPRASAGAVMTWFVSCIYTGPTLEGINVNAKHCLSSVSLFKQYTL